MLPRTWCAWPSPDLAAQRPGQMSLPLPFHGRDPSAAPRCTRVAPIPPDRIQQRVRRSLVVRSLVLPRPPKMNASA
jgi:hypothetical protein